MQLIFSYFFEVQLIGRLTKEFAEVLHRADVGLLGQRRHVADSHVVDHASAQWRHLFGHREAPVGWIAQTRNPDRRDARCDES